MKLRFVKGNFDCGKYKLQYQDTDPQYGWIDVPCVEEHAIPDDSGIELIRRIRACFGFSLGEAKRWYGAMRFHQEKLNILKKDEEERK